MTKLLSKLEWIDLTNGLYIQEITSKMIHVYEKTTHATGYFFSGVASDITKVGLFTFTEIDLNISERLSCGCNVPKVLIKR